MENNTIQYYAVVDKNEIVVATSMSEGIEWYTSEKRHNHKPCDDNGVYLYKIVDGEVVERDEADKLADVKASTIDKIKDNCQNAIYTKYPNWLQNNLQSRALELLERLTEGVELTSEELADKDAIKGIESDIKAMRAKSNELENSLDGMSIDDMLSMVIEY